MVQLMLLCDHGVSSVFYLMRTRAKMREHAALSLSLPPSVSHTLLPPLPTSPCPSPDAPPLVSEYDPHLCILGCGQR